ncbi:hypothetical protein BC938DRAFT_477204 [Jimgerdemannia flammicorona]|uniref:RIIa domain-containing protein n=1 Tax=Jimgerdemannia flammicorona TaxID=994334 RepID=A0A433PB86_9FUNG|nr:hypothetical protein BC938DRAFT_477204 [Jimgerdemannia flammicorona]
MTAPESQFLPAITHQLPEEYTQLLGELNREVSTTNPEDVLQFCANFFNKKLEEQRVRFMSDLLGRKGAGERVEGKP